VKPHLLVVAGPNGAGKTTVTERLRAELWSEGVEYLNPDEIARDRFGDWNSPKAVAEAATWTEARREALLAQRAGIAFETVFSTGGKVDFVRRAKDAGYSEPAIFSRRGGLE
jgi:predicted ABC-type ATPase